MPNFEKMDIDDLIAYRDKLAKQKHEIRAEFIAAGKVLDVKRQEKNLADDYALLEAKRAKLQVKMGIEPEPQKTTLKKLFGG